MASHAFTYLERVAREDHVVAALQEWPFGLPDLGEHRLKFVPIAGKAVLLHSSELVLLDALLDDSERATIARFRLPSGNELACVGVHWHNRGIGSELVDDPYERGGAMALFRHLLEGRLGQDTPAVVMGDFNCSAQEHEREMCSPYCLFAVSERHRTTLSMETVMGQRKRAWRLVEPSCPSHIGTYFWQKTEAWATLDHVVLTPDLYRLLRRADVLTHMAGQPFLTEGKQVPRSAQFASDHLPVICTIGYS